MKIAILLRKEVNDDKLTAIDVLVGQEENGEFICDDGEKYEDVSNMNKSNKKNFYGFVSSVKFERSSMEYYTSICNYLSKYLNKTFVYQNNELVNEVNKEELKDLNNEKIITNSMLMYSNVLNEYKAKSNHTIEEMDELVKTYKDIADFVTNDGEICGIKLDMLKNEFREEVYNYFTMFYNYVNKVLPNCFIKVQDEELPYLKRVTTVLPSEIEDPEDKKPRLSDAKDLVKGIFSNQKQKVKKMFSKRS